MGWAFEGRDRCGLRLGLKVRVDFKFGIGMEVKERKGGEASTDLEALIELLKDIVTLSLQFISSFLSVRASSDTRRGISTYDALYDALEEDCLSFVVGVLHWAASVVGRSGQDQSGRDREVGASV